MIEQIAWLVSLPLVIWITYRLILLVLRFYENRISPKE